MKKELLFSITKKDFDITFFSGTGKGGQHRNKHQNCVRLKHKETGIITTGQNSRSQSQNIKDAFNRMVSHKDFKLYLRLRIARETQDQEKINQQINRKVDEMMQEKYLDFEHY